MKCLVLVVVFCAFLFGLAALTDWLDGFIARRFRSESQIGAALDPVADKLITGAALVLVACYHSLWGWMAALLLCREIGMSGLRLVALEQGVRVKVNYVGKTKTFFLDIALFCLMVNGPLFGLPLEQIGMVAIWISLFLSYYSAYLYLREFWREAKF